MKNNEPNKIVVRIAKELKSKETITDLKEYFDAIEPLKKQLRDLTTTPGAIEVMSKKNILKLSEIESSLRFMEPYKFLIYLSKASKKE